MGGVEPVRIYYAGKDEAGVELGGVLALNPRRRGWCGRKRAEFVFEQSYETGDGFRNAKTAFGAHAFDVALVMQAGVVAGDSEGGAGERVVLIRRPRGSEDSVLRLDAAGALAAQVGLEFVAVFPQVVQQAGEAGFGGGAERIGETLGAIRRSRRRCAGGRRGVASGIRRNRACRRRVRPCGRSSGAASGRAAASRCYR